LDHVKGNEVSSNKVLQKFDLSGQVAVVTGGAGLLGFEFCRTLAEAGAEVVLADLDVQAAARAANTLQSANLQVYPVCTDITNKDSVDDMVGATIRRFGRLDILVNSAALDPKFDPQHQGGHSLAFEGFPLEAWNQALSVNLTGAFLCCQAAAHPMLKQEHGVFINICSTYGLVGPDQRLYERKGEGEPRQYKPVYYSVTKAGILGLTRYLATYYAGKNIRANALTPGGVYNNHDDVFLKAYSARAVMGRMARSDEMNGALLFLASDASSYMTGANLVVDGGWTAW
jgi:NAD(P)-dependent dehydrogenase (short-subunit alcohol dehydrogenase family)